MVTDKKWNFREQRGDDSQAGGKLVENSPLSTNSVITVHSKQMKLVLLCCYWGAQEQKPKRATCAEVLLIYQEALGHSNIRLMLRHKVSHGDMIAFPRSHCCQTNQCVNRCCKLWFSVYALCFITFKATFPACQYYAICQCIQMPGAILIKHH